MKTSFQRLSLSILSLLTLTFGVLGVTPAYAAGIHYVKASGIGNCSSWAAACNLQTALTIAPSGTEIWVAAGVYKPTTNTTDRGATFSLPAEVALYGGFSGTETQRTERNWTANLTILSGDIDNNDSQTPLITNIDTVTGNNTNSYHIITIAGNATIDGFTITAANATIPFGGGGIYILSGNPIVENIVLRGNRSYYHGGGMSIDKGGPMLTNVTFKNNLAMSDGGGLYNFGSATTLINVLFDDNKAASGGAIFNNFQSSLILTDVTFNGNTAIPSGYGGGLYSFEGTSLILTNVAFNNNSAKKGGGFYINTDSPILESVTFYNNTATDYGGGMFIYYQSSPTITNATFINNSAGKDGGGIYNTDGATPIITNSTFSNNTAGQTGSAIANYFASWLRIRNSIFWDNTSPDEKQINVEDSDGSYDNINDSVIQNGCIYLFRCTNVSEDDPKLGSLGNYGGFTQTIPLQTGSSAIDTGNDTNCPATDQRGATRPKGAHCDIGAFEYPGLALTFNSVAAQDGWVLESSETSNIGSTIYSTGPGLLVGDSVTKQQYRSILSFNTSSLPDTAIISGATLKIKKNGFIGGTDQITVFQGFMVDIKTGFFGTFPALQALDFQAPTDKTLGPASPILSAGSYNFGLINAVSYINKLSTNSGLTQIRLRFKLDDNNNAVANYLSLFSGEAVSAADRPQLVIQYYLPLPPTSTPTRTQTPTRTKTPTPTRTMTPTSTKTKTATLTFTRTPSLTPTDTYTQTLTEPDTPTPTPSFTPTVTDTETITPTAIDTETATPANVETDTPTITPTISPTETETETQTPTP